ncbi:hypothetical protein BKI52_20600 [marine bacterium AO1-C]|nr:hypothetical protein BKI52_20600 [marine bacterium AO1-C]
MTFSTNKAFFVITLLVFTAVFSTHAQNDKKILSASSQSTPASAKDMKLAKTKKPWDKKAPKMVLFLQKPQLEVLNHTMRILVKSDKNIFHLKGNASDLVSGVEWVYINGNKVTVDKKGAFETYIHLDKDYNLVKIEAMDKSGNIRTKEVAIQRTTPIKQLKNTSTEASAAERWVTPVKK